MVFKLFVGDLIRQVFDVERGATVFAVGRGTGALSAVGFPRRRPPGPPGGASRVERRAGGPALAVVAFGARNPL